MKINTSYQFCLTKDEQFLETIMTVVSLLRLTHLKEIDMDWTTQEGFVLEREKIVSESLQEALSWGLVKEKVSSFSLGLVHDI